MRVANALASVAGKFPLEFVSDKSLLIYQPCQRPEVCKGFRIVDEFLDRSNFVASALIVLINDAFKKLVCSANNQGCSSLISFWLGFGLGIRFLLLRYFVHMHFALLLGLRVRLLSNIRIIFPFRAHSLSPFGIAKTYLILQTLNTHKIK